MLASYGGDNYKDAEKVNKHIKQMAVEALPSTPPFDELLPPLTPHHKMFMMQTMGFTSPSKHRWVHPDLPSDILIVFDMYKDDISSIIYQIYSADFRNIDPVI
jgi:hypothetical protein